MQHDKGLKRRCNCNNIEEVEHTCLLHIKANGRMNGQKSGFKPTCYINFESQAAIVAFNAICTHIETRDLTQEQNLKDAMEKKISERNDALLKLQSGKKFLSDIWTKDEKETNIEESIKIERWFFLLHSDTRIMNIWWDLFIVNFVNKRKHI
ncbi:hypothetical protein ACJX0J_027756, partial [Zea mays]